MTETLKWSRPSKYNACDETVTRSKCGRFAVIARRHSARWGYGKLEYYLVYSENGELRSAATCDGQTLTEAKSLAPQIASDLGSSLDQVPEGVEKGYARGGKWVVK